MSELTNAQQYQAKKYRRLQSKIGAAWAFLAIAFYLSGSFWLWILISALLILVEGLYSFNIGAAEFGRWGSRRLGSFTKINLIMYMVMASLIAAFALWMKASCIPGSDCY